MFGLSRRARLAGGCIATGLATVLVFGMLAAPASAEELNVSGTWESIYHCEVGWCAGTNFPASGVLSQAPGSTHVSSPPDAEGTLNGNVLTLEGGSSGYHFVEHVTISPDGKTWSGPLSDNNGTSGTDTAIRVSGGGGGEQPAPPAPVGSLHPTTTGLSCGYQPLTAIDTCTATVRDSATSAPSTPTGAVTLTAGGGNAGNGLFPSGSTCQLAGSGPTGLAVCTVEYIPPTFGLTKLQADYAGDATHAPSSTGAPPVAPQACPKSKLTAVTCADPSAPPGVCKAPGPIYPQCYQPTVIPTACSTGVIGNTCQPTENLTVACGSIGTGLPQCSVKSNSVPAQFCGPIGSGLPGCTGVNNPITVCSASGSGLPQCAFTTKITGAILDAGSGTGEVDETISCPRADATASASRVLAAAKPSGGATCRGYMTLNSYIAAQTSVLSPYVGNFAGVYSRLAEGYFAECGCAAAFAQSPTVFATHNHDVAYRRARALLTLALTEERLGAGLTTKAEVNGWYDGLTERGNGQTAYSGPRDIWDSHFTYGNAGSPVGSFAENLVGRLSASIDEGYKLFKGVAKTPGPGSGATSSASLTGVSGGPSFPRQSPLSLQHGKPPGALLTRHLRLRAGQSVKLRLNLSGKSVRKLLHAVGEKANAVPLRVVLAYSSKPRPAVRVVDIAVRIRR